MKVRVRFSKFGPVRFLGHLDTMRYFQKAVRRAGIPIAFSDGFRPHMIMSFAAPLGVGITSDAEYFDMELSEKDAPPMTSEEMIRQFNAVMAEGFRVISVRKLPEGKKYNAMSLTAAADYQIGFSGAGYPENWAEQMEGFSSQPSILAEKKTKKGMKTTDIKPGIYSIQAEPDKYSLRLAASSSNYVKPKMVMEAFAAYLGIDFAFYDYTVHKVEVYANEGNEEDPRFVPLEELGENIG